MAYIIIVTLQILANVAYIIIVTLQILANVAYIIIVTLQILANVAYIIIVTLQILANVAYIIIVTLQILANVAYIIIDSSEEAEMNYGTWKKILIFVGLFSFLFGFVMNGGGVNLICLVVVKLQLQIYSPKIVCYVVLLFAIYIY